MHKQCSKCGEVKAAADFNRKGRGFQPYCRACQSCTFKAYWRNARCRPEQRARIERNRRAYVTAVKALLRDHLEQPCIDCGQQYPPWVMDFDHVRGEKVDAVSTMLRMQRPLRLIEQEIDKCEVVCANCHRQRTYSRYHGGNGLDELVTKYFGV